MAGLYIAIGKSSPERLSSVSDFLQFGDETERRNQTTGVFEYVWKSHDNPEHYAPAHDPRSDVQLVASGRLCWSPQDWQQAERLPLKGGLACRLLLDRYLRQGAQGVAPYNGAAMVVIWDPRDRKLHLWTDQFGYHPSFLYQKGGNCPTVITTFPDAIRHDPSIDSREDLVSMAEFLRAWRATPPNTYYEYLKYAGAATHWCWDVDRQTASSEVYWRPFESGFFNSLDEAAEALASALKSAVSERTAAANRTALFISGGADSRVMLFGADDPAKLVGINLYEHEPTVESATSRKLCDRIGVEYVGFGRDSDYYPRMLAENVRWSGGMWSAEDNHYLGVKHVIDQLGVDLVMTACTTDWVFKGYGLEKTYKKFLGKNLPLLKFTDSRADGFLPNVPREAPENYREAIDERMDRWFEGCPSALTTDLDHLRVEDRRIRPACYTVSVSGQIMFRTYPYDTFLADSRVAECYGRIRAAWKLNGAVWGRAAARVCSGAGDIVDSNHGWALDASNTSKLIAFTKGWVSRRVPRFNRTQGQSASENENHPPSYASWPEYGWYALHSKTLQALWESSSAEHRPRITSLWGSDPWSKPLAEWASTPLDLFRLLTLLQHWQNTTQTSGKA